MNLVSIVSINIFLVTIFVTIVHEGSDVILNVFKILITFLNKWEKQTAKKKKNVLIQVKNIVDVKV